MRQQIPRVILDGTMFNVDYHQKQFVQASYGENTIPFSALKEKSGQLILRYDIYNKCAADDPRSNRYDPKKNILIPKEILDSPELLMDQKGYCKQHNQQSYTGKHNILLIDDQIGDRLSGALPVIEIAGHPFYVDLRMQAIRPKDDFMQILSFRDMYLYKEDGSQFFYKPENHELIKLNDETITEFPPGIVAVHLPSAKVMDPISYARLNLQEETSLLPGYPQQQLRIADVKPLNRTWIASAIKRNKAKAAELDSQQAKPKQATRNSNRIR